MHHQCWGRERGPLQLWVGFHLTRPSSSRTPPPWPPRPSSTTWGWRGSVTGTRHWYAAWALATAAACFVARPSPLTHISMPARQGRHTHPCCGWGHGGATAAVSTLRHRTLPHSLQPRVRRRVQVPGHRGPGLRVRAPCDPKPQPYQGTIPIPVQHQGTPRASPGRVVPCHRHLHWQQCGHQRREGTLRHGTQAREQHRTDTVGGWLGWRGCSGCAGCHRCRYVVCTFSF